MDHLDTPKTCSELPGTNRCLSLLNILMIMFELTSVVNLNFMLYYSANARQADPLFMNGLISLERFQLEKVAIFRIFK